MADMILKIVLWWQGLYYGITGVWAIVALDHFSRVTKHFGDPFEMYSIAALAVVLSLAFIWGAVRQEQRRFAGWIALGSAVAVIIPELVYFSEIRGTLFIPDLFEEIIVGFLLLFALLKSRG